MSRPKVAVVGGIGYIGSALMNHLNCDFDVRIIDKRPLPDMILPKNVEYKSCDIVEYAQLQDAIRGAEVVIHTAIVQIPLINDQKKLGYAVNIVGTQNLCKAVSETDSVKGMVLIGSWHVFGERGLEGTIDEGFGFRPDAVPERAHLYALSKIGQETVTRMYSEMSEKAYAIVRVGTVLGEGMPAKTAANIFIDKGLQGQSITPYSQDMHRPMLYVDIEDVCEMCRLYASRILNGNASDLPRVVNLFWPKPITILELAEGIRDTIVRLSHGATKPRVEVIDRGVSSAFTNKSGERIVVNIERALALVGSGKLTDPWKSIERIVQSRMKEAAKGS